MESSISSGPTRRSCGSAMDTSGAALETPLGWAAAAARNGRVVAVSLPATSREAAVRGLGIDADFSRPDDVLKALAGDLQRYFAGERVSFERYQVDLGDQPPFLARVLRAARTIPHGQLRSYGWLAAAAGNPRAARAAGQAMARNPLPIVIPCHRVIAANGGLGGFGGGLKMKRALLALEGVRLT